MFGRLLVVGGGVVVVGAGDQEDGYEPGAVDLDLGDMGFTTTGGVLAPLAIGRHRAPLHMGAERR